MQSIIIASSGRKALIQKMKRERRPSRRLRMHIVLLYADGRSPTEISRVLFCSRTTVYAVAGRFIREEQAAFNDRKMRGPKPSVGQPASEYIERGCSNRTHPPNMAGCAHAGVASSWPWSCSRSGPPCLAGRRFVACSIAWAFAGEDRARSRPGKIQNTIESKSAGDSWTSFRWSSKRGRSSRTRPGWRRTPRWVSARCAKGSNDR